MKILFCDNKLESFLNFRGNVAEYLHNKGIDVGVLAPKNTCTEAAMAKVPDYLKVFPVRMNSNSSNPLSDISYFSDLRKIFKSERPDLLFLYTIKPNIYGSIAAKAVGIPAVAMVTGLGYVFAGDSIKQRLSRAFYKFGLKRSERVIVLNSSNRDTLISRNFAGKEKLIFFEGGEGVELDRFPRVADEYDNVRFLMVSRVLYDKGYTEFVDAAKLVKNRYPDIKIELLGPSGEDSPMGVPNELVSRDEEAGYITWLGATNDVAGYLAKPGTVMVLASYHEGLNRSLMEACAMGRVCITSDIPGCRESVDEGLNGFLVPPKNAEALAEAMLKAIELTAEQRRQMAEHSYKKAVKLFDMNRVKKYYDEIISSVLGSKS